MALSNPPLTPQMDEELENYLRMRVFLEHATDVLRDVLTRELQKAYPGDFDPSTGILYNVLNIPAVRKNLVQLSRRNVLNASQKQILYPARAPSSTAKVNDFDVTLTVLLLRNITTLNLSAKWDNPPSTDLSTEADIGRVKTYRNNHMHGAARLPKATFQSDFKGLKTVLLRLSKIYTEQDYDQLLIKPIQSSGVPATCQLMSVNLPRKDGNFCGREDLLTEIQQQFKNKTELLLLTGMGGIGKTSIAVEMGHRMSEKGRDVLFLDMRQIENVDSVQLSLVQHFNPKMFLTEIYADYQNLFQKNLSEIKSATLVIFDNIDHLVKDQALKQFLKLVQDMLKASKHISLVCTSRESFDFTSVKVVEKHVPPLDDYSSTQLLSGVTPAPTDREAGVLKEIAARCGNCPLALKLLAPQIREKGSSRLLEKMEKKGVLKVAHISSCEGLMSCFEISFGSMSVREKALFSSLCIFPVSFHLSDVSNILEMDEDECEDILDELASKSVVNQVSDRVYDLHPLLNAFSESQAKRFPGKKLKTEISYCRYYSDRAATLEVISEFSTQKYANETAVTILPHLLCSGKLLLKHLNKYLQNKSISDTVMDRDVVTDYDHFIRRLLDITDILTQLYLFNEPLQLLNELANILKTKQYNALLKNQTSIYLSSIYERAGRVLLAMGKYDDALKYQKKGLEIREELLGTEHTDTARSYNNTGNVLRIMGKYGDALKYLYKSLAINEEQFSMNPTNTADSYSNIGDLLYDMGKYDDALPYHRKSLEIREMLLGTKHIKTAGSYNSIGNLLYGMGKYDDALTYYKKCLAICEELLGTEHNETAHSYNNIGLVLRDMGKLDDALTYLKKSLEVREKLLGTNHTQTAAAYNNIGLVLQGMGKLYEALTYQKKGLEIHEKVLGTNHPTTAYSYTNYGDMLRGMGKYNDALTYHMKGLAIYETLFGTNHTMTAALYHSVGLVLHEMGKPDDALTHHMQSLEVREKLLGTNHPKTADSYKNIGIVLRDMGRFDDALTYLKKSLKIWEELFGTKHEGTAALYSDIGHVLLNMGQYDNAFVYQKKAIEIFEEVLGTKHTKTADSYNNIGIVLRGMGKNDDALTYLQKAVEIYEDLLGTKHIKTAVAHVSIAASLRNMGNYAETLKYLKNALDVYVVHFGIKHQKTASCYLSIGEILVDLKLYRDGVFYLKEAASVQEELFGVTHQDTIGTCKMIGTVLIQMGQFAEAIKYFEKINWDIVIVQPTW